MNDLLKELNSIRSYMGSDRNSKRLVTKGHAVVDLAIHIIKTDTGRVLYKQLRAAFDEARDINFALNGLLWPHIANREINETEEHVRKELYPNERGSFRGLQLSALILGFIGLGLASFIYGDPDKPPHKTSTTPEPALKEPQTGEPKSEIPPAIITVSGNKLWAAAREVKAGADWAVRSEILAGRE